MGSWDRLLIVAWGKGGGEVAGVWLCHHKIYLIIQQVMLLWLLSPSPLIVLAVTWQSIFSLVLPLYSVCDDSGPRTPPPPENHAEKFFLNESSIK